MASRAVTGVASLDRRLAGGEVLLLDGGMGTELEARGVPMDQDAWSAVANLDHADTVEQAHVEFLDAGADILIATIPRLGGDQPTRPPANGVAPTSRINEDRCPSRPGG